MFLNEIPDIVRGEKRIPRSALFLEELAHFACRILEGTLESFKERVKGGETLIKRRYITLLMYRRTAGARRRERLANHAYIISTIIRTGGCANLGGNPLKESHES
jgi:hypothetical protein